MSKGRGLATASVKADIAGLNGTGKTGQGNGGKPGESSSMAGTEAKASKGGVVSDSDLADDELMQSLRRHDASFTALLSLIPAHLYLAPESDSERGSEAEFVTEVGKAKKRKQDPAAEAAERRARIREAKRAKLDPDNHKNAIEVQQERAAKKAGRMAAQGGEQDGLMDLSFDVGDVHAGDTDSESEDGQDSGDDGESYETLPTSAKGSEELSDMPAIPSPKPGAGPPSILDLRARLQAKIQGMQAQRRAPNGGHDPLNGSIIGDDESTASTKDELLEERRKKRGEMRDKRRKAAKDRKRAEREQVGQKGTSAANGNDNKGGSKAPALFVSPGGRADGLTASSAPMDAAGGDIAFSSIHFDGEDERSRRKSKHSLPSDPKAALAILEARKRKEEAQKAKREARLASSEDAAESKNAANGMSAEEKERAEQQRWSKAEAAAQGVKIRDDETLLRKAAKKRDKVKIKSSNEWSKRSRDLASQQAARQKKRSDNIAARKDRKMKGKGGKGGSQSSSAKSKALGGRKGGAEGGKRGTKKARPGFEGKPRSFGKSSRGGSGKKAGGGKA